MQAADTFSLMMSPGENFVPGNGGRFIGTGGLTQRTCQSIQPGAESETGGYGGDPSYLPGKVPFCLYDIRKL